MKHLSYREKYKIRTTHRSIFYVQALWNPWHQYLKSVPSWKAGPTFGLMCDPCPLLDDLGFRTPLDKCGLADLMDIRRSFFQLDDLRHWCLSNRRRTSSDSRDFSPRSRLNKFGCRSVSGGLRPLWRTNSLSPRPLSASPRRGSCPRWWIPKPITEVENGTEDEVRIRSVISTHPLTPSVSSLFPRNFCHLLTTSSILGRFLGFCCQQLSRSLHISPVSPNA